MSNNNFSDDELDEAIENAKSGVKSSQQQTIKVENTTKNDWWSVKDAMTVSTVMLGFFFMVLLLATYLIKIGTNTDVLLKFFGTILIISTTSFLIIVGYNNEQITPVIGLLGTIAGYLLGKDNKDDNTIIKPHVLDDKNKQV